MVYKNVVRNTLFVYLSIVALPILAQNVTNGHFLM